MNILQPIKSTITILESKTATLADCFFYICCLESSLYYIPAITNNIYQNFHDYSFKKFNNRWQEFDYKIFVLAYFLHPVYRGKF